jgi:hypothetical protein
MVKIVSEKIAHSHTYQRALDDFGITELLSCISNYVDEDFKAALMNLDEQEVESLAAILIQRLTHNLNGKLIANYLNAIRHGDSHVISDPTHLEIPPPSIELPTHFPDDVAPQYQEGDRVRWRPLTHTTDWGMVIGRFYARHHCQWAVCYLIQLDQDSPSAAWTVADTAWEKDLEPNTHQAWEKPSDVSSFCKSVHTAPGNYHDEAENRTHPRTLTQRERDAIALYSHCQLGLTPRKFYSKWSVRYEELAAICSRSSSTVQRWFSRGRNYQRPTSNDLRHLAIMDFLLEHFEEIPSKLLNLLCPQKSSQ